MQGLLILQLEGNLLLDIGHVVISLKAKYLLRNALTKVLYFGFWHMNRNFGGYN